MDRVAPFTYEDTVLASDSLEKGEFTLRFRKASLGYGVFKDGSGETMLFLKEGDSLFMKKGLHGEWDIEGKGAQRNRYLRRRASFRDSLAQIQGNIFSLEKEEFLEAIEERRKAFKDFRSSQFSSGNEELLEPSFKRLEKLRDQVDLALTRTSYPVIYQHENPLDSLHLSKDYWNFLDSMDLDDPRLLEVPQFLNFAYSLANKYTFENKGKKRSMAYRQMLYGTIEEEFKGKVRNAVLTYFMLEQIRYSDEGVDEKLLKRYQEDVDNERMLSYVKKRSRSLEKKDDPT